jgi:solute carrier family 13 (sodium-dependent dicarboxylate transporter), member 2/3/5
MTALLGVVLCALLEATPPPPEGDSSVDVVFGLFTDDTVMLFIGSFIIAQAMVVHGLHRRLAYRVLSMPWVGGNSYRIILAFGLIGAITSPVMSNTVGAAIMVPIAISIAAASDLNPTIPALAAIFGANYGFMLPVSTPPNAIVYSSGLLPITRMIKAGLVFDIIGAVLCVVGVTVMANVVGLA